jgi:cytochrome c oxidase subunit I
MTGRMYNEHLGRSAAIATFIGFILAFLPQFVLGYAGMPRRYHEYPPEFETWHALSSAGAVVLAIGYLLPLFYLPASLRSGRPAGGNPWKVWDPDEPQYGYPPPRPGAPRSET